MSHVHHLSTTRPRQDDEPKILQSVVRPMMHCGGGYSTRCLSGKELRPSGHSGLKIWLRAHCHCAVRSCTPTVSSLRPSIPDKHAESNRSIVADLQHSSVGFPAIWLAHLALIPIRRAYATEIGRLHAVGLGTRARKARSSLSDACMPCKPHPRLVCLHKRYSSNTLHERESLQSTALPWADKQ